MEKKATGKKVGRIIGNIVFVLFLVLILFIAITNLKAKSNHGIPNIFGKGFLEVASDSMNGDKPDSFKKGDLVVVDVVDLNDSRVKELKVDDIITYYDTGEAKIISHRIIEVKGTANIPVYVVKGDSPDAVKTTEVNYTSVMAIYNHKVAGLGTVVGWFSTPTGFFIIVVLPCVAFLVYEIYHFVKTLTAYNKEKNKGASKEVETEQLVALRKEALEDLVKSGVLSTEEAETKQKQYQVSLSQTEDEEVKEENKE